MGLLKRTERAVISAMPDGAFNLFANARNRLTGKRHRIARREDGLYDVTDGAERLVLSQRHRHRRSKRGVVEGATDLARVYFLERAEIAGPGLLIDCGANIGELGIWARAKGLDYLAFEPEEREARCADLNAYDGAARTRRQALWHENGTLTFYRKAGNADSSLIAIAAPDETVEVDAVRLDSILDPAALKGCVILKVEAEGAEPEVLEGASGLLERIDWITVDCGYERGEEQRHTFCETNRFLTANGFEVVEADLKKRRTFLYRRV